MPSKILPQSDLKELFDYDPDTGILTWRIRPADHFKTRQAFDAWNTKYAGKAAGSLNNDGYLQVGINGNRFQAHRIIYKWLHNEEPEQIDHINHVRDNNRSVNLRAATNQINGMNRNMNSNNTSGVMGVSWFKPSSKWRADIWADGKQINLGYFDAKKDAINARQSAETEYGYHPNHGRS